ncbi:MAG: hypothetical protein EPO68_12560 [Planctomycetota bacterium]|nr:MAG: hypothetical protein EPO68_12560 [Planctomycetota bacterium]
MNSDLIRRVRRLELLSLVACVALGATLLASMASPDPVTVRASRFEMLDADGRVRGYWRMTDDGSPAFSLYDADGSARFWMTVAPNGNSELCVKSAAGALFRLHVDGEGHVTTRTSR